MPSNPGRRKTGCLAQAMAAQVGRDPSPSLKRRDLAAPHRAVEHKAMDEQYRRAHADVVVGETDALHFEMTRSRVAASLTLACSFAFPLGMSDESSMSNAAAAACVWF